MQYKRKQFYISYAKVLFLPNPTLSRASGDYDNYYTLLKQNITSFVPGMNMLSALLNTGILHL